MAQAYQLRLSPQQEQELQHTLTHDEKPYLRERCSAILKVAQGLSIRQVATHGLLQVRSEETVSQWITDALDLWLDKHREESTALLHEIGLLPTVSYPD